MEGNRKRVGEEGAEKGVKVSKRGVPNKGTGGLLTANLRTNYGKSIPFNGKKCWI